MKSIELTTRYRVRAYDAMQLASGLLANKLIIEAAGTPLTFLVADDHLTGYAQAEGLLTDDPNLH